MSNFLKNTNLKNKKITLEVYKDIPLILKRFKILRKHNLITKMYF